MDTLTSELNLLASLLNAPDIDTKEAVLELAAYYPWLQPAADELAQLSVDAWRDEHSRLFHGYDNTDHSHNCGLLNLYRNSLPLQTLKQLGKRMGMGIIDMSADYLEVLLECTAHLQANPALGKVFWSELWHEHFAHWIPDFCNELKRKSQLVLYRIIAERLYELFPQVQLLATAI